MKFSFFKKRIKGKEIDLVPTFTVEPHDSNNHVKTVGFDICLTDSFIKVGRCDLRIGMNEELYYLGNIGYSVFSEFQGNHYAMKACLLLFEEAKHKYHMEELIITCNPDNEASRRTLEKLNGNMLEVAQVPSDHYCYKIGDYYKCIFKYTL